MKILQCINSLATGGAEKLIVDSVPLYQNKGLQVDVLLLNGRKTPFFKILEAKSNGKIFGLTNGSVYNPLLIFKIIPFLKKYDIIHVHLFPMLYWVAMAKWLSFSKAKIVYTEHNTDNRRRHHAVLKFFDRLIYRAISQMVAISQEVQDQLIAHLSFKKISLFSWIHNGIDVDFFKNSIPYPKSDFFGDKDFLLIQVSSFRYPKDQPTLIKSLLHLPHAIKLLLVGEGPLIENCTMLVDELKLNDRVKFLGVRTDVASLLKTCDVVVLSSHYEGLSLSSVEGMVSKPFIASNVAGLKEVVGGYGLLFECGEALDLARQVLSLYNDRFFYDEIQKKCHERSSVYNIQKMIIDYINVYKNLENEN